MNNTKQKTIPVFFAIDDNYAPYFAVAVKSLLLNASKNYYYSIHVLHDGISSDTAKRLKEYETENSEIVFDDVSVYLTEKIKLKLTETLRDYYTPSIFYRIFIAALYPSYDKAIYLDSDIVVTGDVSSLYFKELNSNILAAVPDDVIAGNPVFQKYAKVGVGVDYRAYFNSGVLLINLNAFRTERIKEKFVFYLLKYNFESCAPDQDYLNVLCKDRVLYLEKGWDRMSTDEDFSGEINIIHYNNFRKPWLCDDVPYERYFWKYAEMTDYYKELKAQKSNFTKDEEKALVEGLNKLVLQAEKISNASVNFRTVFEQEEKQKVCL